MAEQLQERAKKFLDHWRGRGALPNMQDSWSARVVSRYARGVRFTDVGKRNLMERVQRLERIESSPPDSLAEAIVISSGLRVGHDCKPEVAREYREELIELLKEILAERHEGNV